MARKPVKKMLLDKIEMRNIDDVRPYWRNPRRVTEDAVNMLAKSISEFGYQQPIVTDSDYVIIVGHTRYAALRRLGVTQVPVMVATTLSPEQVKQYRLIDNKVAEFTFWDYTALVDEVEGLDAELMASFFPEISGEAIAGFSDDETLEREWDKVDTTVDFTCPRCYHSWEVEVTKAALMAGVIQGGTETAKEDSA
jgi:hypothetical protein